MLKNLFAYKSVLIPGTIALSLAGANLSQAYAQENTTTPLVGTQENTDAPTLVKTGSDVGKVIALPQTGHHALLLEQSNDGRIIFFVLPRPAAPGQIIPMPDGSYSIIYMKPDRSFHFNTFPTLSKGMIVKHDDNNYGFIFEKEDGTYYQAPFKGELSAPRIMNSPDGTFALVRQDENGEFSFTSLAERPQPGMIVKTAEDTYTFVYQDLFGSLAFEEYKGLLNNGMDVKLNDDISASVQSKDGSSFTFTYTSEKRQELIENIQLLGSATKVVGTRAFTKDIQHLDAEEIFRRVLKGFPAEILERAGVDVNSVEKFTSSQQNMAGTLFKVFDQLEIKDYDEYAENAVSYLMETLDAHSGYTKPADLQDMNTRTRGEFGGLGFQVTLDEKTGMVKIISTFDDTPASTAGLLPDDLISSIDGKPAKGLSVSDAVGLMRGKVGTDITIGIQRGGQELPPMTLTRAIIEMSPVTYENIDGIGRIHLNQFSAKSEKKIIEAINDLESQGVTSYILDLRFNPGGLLDQAYKVADIFLDNGGEIVYSESRFGKERVYTADNKDLINGKPLVVLTNGGSASASEIVAGALKEHGRATVIGTQTFGKGSVQTIMPLSKGAARLTTALYYLKDGISIQNYGVTPDIKVTFGGAAEVQLNRKEADMEGTIANPNSPLVRNSTQECRPANDNPAAFDSLGDEFRFALSFGRTQSEDKMVDAAKLCAVELLKGTNVFTTRTDIQVTPQAEANKQPALKRG